MKSVPNPRILGSLAEHCKAEGEAIGRRGIATDEICCAPSLHRPQETLGERFGVRLRRLGGPSHRKKPLRWRGAHCPHIRSIRGIELPCNVRKTAPRTAKVHIFDHEVCRNHATPRPRRKQRRIIPDAPWRRRRMSMERPTQRIDPLKLVHAHRLSFFESNQRAKGTMPRELTSRAGVKPITLARPAPYLAHHCPKSALDER